MKHLLPVILSAAVVGLAPAAIAQQTQPSPTRAMQRLGTMFSPQIQSTVNACWQRGKVNLAVGAGTNGAVQCGDGSSEPGVAYQDYLETIADILTASSLVGFRSVMQSDNRLTPEILAAFVSSSEGVNVLRTTIQTAIAQSDLIPTSATESTTILTNAVLERLTPVLKDTVALNSLYGTPQQYSRVVSNFCNAPGMSVQQARSNVPELSNLQLYAICIQESGVARDIIPGRGETPQQSQPPQQSQQR